MCLNNSQCDTQIDMFMSHPALQPDLFKARWTPSYVPKTMLPNRKVAPKTPTVLF